MPGTAMMWNGPSVSEVRERTERRLGGFLCWGVLALILISVSPARAEDRCRECHQGIETMSASHVFSCGRCHAGNASGETRSEAHEGLVANPASLDHARETCGSCHPDQVTWVERSLMSTAAGIINQTRVLFGAQEPGTVRYATAAVAALEILPEPLPDGNLVDDLLRKKCLRCHLRTPGAQRAGEARSLGCAACHILYSDDGQTLTGDQAVRAAIREGSTPDRTYPVRHELTLRIPSSQCLRCHNGNRVGADYVGLFERDYAESYRFLSPDGSSFFPRYGLDHHRLLPDVHFERGLHCIDCHVQAELMGNGEVVGFAFQALKVGCEDCHGRPGRMPETRSASATATPGRTGSYLRDSDAEPQSGERIVISERGEPLRNVKVKGNRLVLTSRVTGASHEIPGIWDLDPQPLDHRIPEHMEKMMCHSCHAAWSFQDYGMHLFREDGPDYEKWRPLWAQNDPEIQRLLRINLALPPEERRIPETRDWINGGLRLGAWYSGWSYRRWSEPVFGRGADGRVRVLRPLYQFLITWVDREGEVRLDSWIPRTRDGRPGFAMNPYAPHTVRKGVHRCETCHLNPVSAGLGPLDLKETDKGREAVPLTMPWKDGLDMSFQWSQVVTPGGEAVQTATQPGARFFDARELQGLLHASRTYRWYRLQDLGYYR